MCSVALHTKSELRSFLREILSLLRPDTDAQESLQEVLSAILDLFKARKIALVLRNSSTSQIFRWAVNSHPQESSLFGSASIADQAESQASSDPIRSISCLKTGSGHSYLALDRNGYSTPVTPAALNTISLPDEPFRSLLVTNLEFGREWTGRLFLLDTSCAARRVSRLRMLQQVVDEVGLVTYNFHLWRQASVRARTIERKRLARDLHDGVVQSILAAEVRLEILRQRGLREDQPSLSSQALLNAQNVLRSEARKLRRQIEELRSGRLDGMLLPRLKEMTEDFQQDTGIITKLRCNVEEHSTPSWLLTEMLHMVEEALSNIRKHSGARTVDICLELHENTWRIQVKDDGCGFDFSGRLSLSQLDVARKGPRVIRERVHSANGELAIESYPNRGACLDIRLAVNG